ncbi:MAG: universal stress protein [Gaiellaceae bacterium]
MKILLAYDGFEHSRHALEETAKLAADGHGEVTVVSVVPPDAQARSPEAMSVCALMPTRTWPERMRTFASVASSQR